MKNAFVVLAIAGGALVGALGCNPAPYSINKVDTSELPAAAKALIAPDAKITAVHEVHYAKGATDYLIDYSVPNGPSKQLLYGNYRQSQPSGVFEKFEVPEMSN